jgi:hypothetical protein
VLDARELEGDPDTPVASAMRPGPSTYRDYDKAIVETIRMHRRSTT